MHEDLGREERPGGPSDRNFGLTFAAFFALVAAYRLWGGGSYVLAWFAASVASLIVALAWPSILAPLNRAWMRLAHLIAKVTSPVFLGLIYALTIIPIGLCLRVAKCDPLRRKFDPGAASYWIRRKPPSAQDSMRNQF